MKKTLGLLLLVVLSSVVIAVQASNAAMEVKAAHVASPKHPYGVSLEKFAELVKQKTNGEITVHVYHAGQLGNERDVIEGLQLGSMEFTAVSTGPLVNFEKKFFLFDLPFFFRDNQHAYKALDGEIGGEISKLLLAKGIRILGFMENGWFNITNNKRPLHGLKDLQGLKIRTMENSCQLDTLSAFGANPSPMAWSEVYSAMQQGVMDGQQNTFNAIWDSKFQEVQKYLIRTNHIYNPEPFLVSEKFFQKLSPTNQNALRAAALEAVQFQRKLQGENAATSLQNLAKAGMDVYTLSAKDLDEFKTASKPIYEKYDDVVGKELIRKVQQLQ